MITLAELSTKRPENAVLDAKVVSFRIYDIANMPCYVRDKIQDALNELVDDLEIQGKVLDLKKTDVEFLFVAFVKEKKFQIHIQLNNKIAEPSADAMVGTNSLEISLGDPEFEVLKEFYFTKLKSYSKHDIVRMEALMSRHNIGDTVYKIDSYYKDTKEEIKCPVCNGVGYTLRLDIQEVATNQKVLASSLGRRVKCPNCANGIIIKDGYEYGYHIIPVTITDVELQHRKAIKKKETVYQTNKGDCWEHELYTKEAAEQRCAELNKE